MEFYPSKFYLITDLLDTFGKTFMFVTTKYTWENVLGKLVYTRLLEKSAPPNGKIRKKIVDAFRRTEDERNWFF